MIVQLTRLVRALFLPWSLHEKRPEPIADRSRGRELMAECPACHGHVCIEEIQLVAPGATCLKLYKLTTCPVCHGTARAPRYLHAATEATQCAYLRSYTRN